MKIGDLVTYGDWFESNVTGPNLIGVIIQPVRRNEYVLVAWAGHEPAWECIEDLKVLNESR